MYLSESGNYVYLISIHNLIISHEKPPCQRCSGGRFLRGNEGDFK